MPGPTGHGPILYKNCLPLNEPKQFARFCLKSSRLAISSIHINDSLPNVIVVVGLKTNTEQFEKIVEVISVTLFGDSFILISY